MRILILGAGATGGYFGGRLAQAGAEVTFLVRAARAAQLAARGLIIRSRSAVQAVAVQTLTQLELASARQFDLALCCCKAYSLPAALQALAPLSSADTLILPLLNGLAHYPALDQIFGRARVLGGLCHLSATLSADGDIEVLGNMHQLTFGARDPAASAACAAMMRELSVAQFDTRLSEDVAQDAWEKFAFLAAAAGITTLMRAPVGVILSTVQGRALTQQLIDECEAIAAAAGHRPGDAAREMTRRTLLAAGSTFTASMLRDMVNGGPTEAQHILGDLHRRAGELNVAAPLLATAWSHMQAYEAQRRG